LKDNGNDNGDGNGIIVMVIVMVMVMSVFGRVKTSVGLLHCTALGCVKIKL
jgi:hypothetical protein